MKEGPVILYGDWAPRRLHDTEYNRNHRTVLPASICLPWYIAWRQYSRG